MTIFKVNASLRDWIIPIHHICGKHIKWTLIVVGESKRVVWRIGKNSWEKMRKYWVRVLKRQERIWNILKTNRWMHLILFCNTNFLQRRRKNRSTNFALVLFFAIWADWFYRLKLFLLLQNNNRWFFFSLELFL